MSAGKGSVVGGLSFRRIIDIPFETCVAALESWQRTAQDGDLPIGQSVLHGPIEHDRGSGTCRIEVRLARGPLRMRLRMRLHIDRWSSSSTTALELIPCKRVRPTVTYFRAGHLLLDSLTQSLPQHAPAQRAGPATASQPHGHQDGPRPGAPAAGSASRATPVPDLSLPNRCPGRIDDLAGRHHSGAGTAAHQHPERRAHHIARFMDFHDDLKLPAEAIAQIAEDTRNAKADRFGVRQIELYHNRDGKAYCLLEGPNEEAIRQHHAALGMTCGDVHQVNSLT